MNIKRFRVSEKKKWNTIKDYLHFLRHKKAYIYAGEFCKDKNILDYGCGNGYGTFYLSNQAKKIIGIDIDKNIINYCKKNYSQKNLSFQEINSFPLPFNDKHFDVIVSFQVIEHIKIVSKYLYEIKRILKEDGVVLITTVNRKYRLLPYQMPWNPEHFREYSFKKLKNELMAFFNKIVIKGIYGNREINAIEYRRMIKLKNPFMAYIFTPCMKILKKLLPTNIVSRLEQKISKENRENDSQKSNIDLFKHKNYNENYTVGDNLKKSLDFLAICKKR